MLKQILEQRKNQRLVQIRHIDSKHNLDCKHLLYRHSVSWKLQINFDGAYQFSWRFCFPNGTAGKQIVVISIFFCIHGKESWVGEIST